MEARKEKEAIQGTRYPNSKTTENLFYERGWKVGCILSVEDNYSNTERRRSVI
jgi:hypothetical protein